MVNRRKFIRRSAGMAAGYLLFGRPAWRNDKEIMTVNGWIPAKKMGFTLTHEHIMVDFIGADKIDPLRYNADEVFNVALPKLMAAKERGCQTLMECTPAWLGRDVKLLRRLSEASGLTILTNTGYYGAAGEKYLPAYAYKETAGQVAARWIDEWENGIDGSGIKPGFIKSGVDNYPLSAVQQKMMEAAAITHLATGLTIGVHTGNGQAAMEELRIIESKRVRAEAWIWIHAQNERNRELHIRAAKAGGWVSFDGVSTESIPACLDFLTDMRKENLLQHVLLSHDSGWYHVGEANGGNYSGYDTIPDNLLPALKANGFTEKEVQLLFFSNPAKAFTVSIRKK